MTTTLLSPSGTALWSKSFKGSGFTLNFFDGYTSAARQSMNEILNEMVKEFSGDEFRKALTSGV